MRALSSTALLMASLLLSIAMMQGAAVEIVASGRMTISGPHGSGQLALDSDAELTAPQPDITRAIVVFHGFSATPPDICMMYRKRAAERAPPVSIPC
jgi:hypothetical protein